MSNFTTEQLDAIKAEGKTIVSASAGSGKTTVMIEKIVRLITAGTLRRYSPSPLRKKPRRR